MDEVTRLRAEVTALTAELESVRMVTPAAVGVDVEPCPFETFPTVEAFAVDLVRAG